LRSYGEGDRTVLDNTAVYWCSEVSVGSTHSFKNMRTVILGSCGGFFRTGRHVRLNAEPHNKLLVTLLHAMGVPQESFGDPAFGSGPLTGI
jgi:hypothetical protein